MEVLLPLHGHQDRKLWDGHLLPADKGRSLGPHVLSADMVLEGKGLARVLLDNSPASYLVFSDNSDMGLGQGKCAPCYVIKVES